MLLRFVGLRHVPFTFYACSEECKQGITSDYSTIQKQLQEQIDREYQEEVRTAEEFVKRGGKVDISQETINAPEVSVCHFVAPAWRANGWTDSMSRRFCRSRRRRRRRMCSIM